VDYDSLVRETIRGVGYDDAPTATMAIPARSWLRKTPVAGYCHGVDTRRGRQGLMLVLLATKPKN